MSQANHPKTRFGHSSVEHKTAKSILTRPSGFIGAYDFTLNPYTGCAFGCNYCYAAFFARTDDLKDTWGQWLHVKTNALELLKRKRQRPLINKTIYMSSVTDPYQPIEKRLELTRSILEELLTYHQARLVIQTRGTLVTRDLDLLRQFEYLQVNMTVTTDDERVRRAFEPTCPSNPKRLDAIQELAEAGIQTCITLTPLLPVTAPERFAERLLETGVPKFVVQMFHAEKSRFVASTGAAALEMARELGWNQEKYEATAAILRQHLPNVLEGQAGFFPMWNESMD
jgi:DNA repair photolyase